MRNNSDKIIIFPGCLILYRFPEYEASTRRLVMALGYELQPMGQAICCGAYLEGVYPHWMRYSALILAQAAKQGGRVVTLCGGCANAFTRTRQALSRDCGVKRDIGDWLHSQGLDIRDLADSMHLLEFLAGHPDKVANKITRALPWRVAPVYPCQVFRPGSAMRFDDPLQPRSLDVLIRITGAQVADYPQKYSCCGASAEIDGPKVAFGLARTRLEQLRAVGAGVLVTACGNCHRLLQKLQPMYDPGPFFPGLFLPQLLGLALGLGPEELQIERRVMRAMGIGDGLQDILPAGQAVAVSKPRRFPRRRAKERPGKSGQCRGCGACRAVCPVERGGGPSLAAQMLDPAMGQGYCCNCWLCHEICPEGVDVWKKRFKTLGGNPVSTARQESWLELAKSGFCLPINLEINEMRSSRGLPPITLPDAGLRGAIGFNEKSVSK